MAHDDPWYDDYEDDDDGLPVGEVRDAVALDLAALITPHPMGDALRALALHLAGTIDVCPQQTRAGLAKELRATIADLVEFGKTENGDDLDAEASEITPPPAPPKGDG